MRRIVLQNVTKKPFSLTKKKCGAGCAGLTGSWAARGQLPMQAKVDALTNLMRRAIRIVDGHSKKNGRKF